MTVIAGFQCLDGLLLCADTEQSFSSSDSKSQVRKIESLVLGGASIAIGGAGDLDLIEYVTEQLKTRFLNDASRRDIGDQWMESFAKHIWNVVIRPYRGFSPQAVPEASFLIGLQAKGECSLYKWERNMIHQVPLMIHTSIGIGMTQAEPLLAELNSFRVPIHQTLLYAVRAMLRVKQFVQGCGGKTEAVVLMNDGFILKPWTRQIDAIEYLVEEMDYELLARAVGFIAGCVNTDEQTDLSEHVELLKKYKARYEKIMPDLFSWHRKGEITF